MISCVEASLGSVLTQCKILLVLSVHLEAFEVSLFGSANNSSGLAKGENSNRKAGSRRSSTTTEAVLWNFGCLDLVVHGFDVLRQEPALGHKLGEASIDPRRVVFLILVEFFENRFGKPDLCPCNLA